MSFTINLEQEDGKIIESIDDGGLLAKCLLDIKNSNFCCIKYIDSYGDTVFNRLQMDDLIKDISIIKDNVKTKEFDELAEKIIGFAEKCKNEVHLYLKFYGD